MSRIIYNIWTSIINFKNRWLLENRTFSIISNSCIGNVIYHKLAIPYQTPFIGISFDNKAFPLLAQDLASYMAEKLKFVNIGASYPTAYMGDILLHFEHYSSEEQALMLWEKRKPRINYNNLFFIMSDRPTKEPITESDILKLKEVDCRGKVVFSVLNIPEINYIIHLPKDDKHECVNDYMKRINFWGRWEWEEKFNYVKWLNFGHL